MMGESTSREDTFTDEVIKTISDLGEGNTFALLLDARTNSFDAHPEYCRIVTNYTHSRSARIAEIEQRREPSREYWYPNSIYETDDGEAIIKRMGPSDIDIRGITTDPLAVDYSPNCTLLAECDLCGHRGVIPVDESELPTTTPGLTENAAGETVTVCCGTTEWSTTLKTD